MFKSFIAINNILLSNNGITIPRNKNLLEGSNSVCFFANATDPHQFMVQFDNASKIPKGAHIHLKGNSGISFFSGFYESGNEVQLTCNFVMDNLYTHPSTNMVLEIISVNNDVIRSQPVKLRLYYIPVENESALLYRKGLPVEILEEICRVVGNNLTSMNGAEEGTIFAPLVQPAQIVNGNFTQTPPNYDVWRGAAYFVTITTWNSITFHYKAFLAARKNPKSILNCYDCAAIIQFLFNVNNSKADYCYMNPYGYMTSTNLIGWGKCNSPFFQGVVANKVVVPATSATRTAFGNHAFVRLKSTQGIADLCAGPHVGNELINAYITNAVDTNVPNPPAVVRGTTASVGYYAGVTKTDLIEPVITNMFSDQIGNVIFNKENLNSDLVQSHKSLCSMPTIESLVNQSGWKTVYSETIGGEQECLLILYFEKGDQLLQLRIFAANENNQHAINRFFDLALNIQSPDHGLSKVEDSPYHQHVESKSEGHQISIIHYYNLALQLYTSDSGIQLTELTKSFINPINAMLVPSDIKKKEVKTEILFDASTKQYKVSLIDPGVDDVIEFIDQEGNLKLIDSSKHSLVFEKIHKKKTTIKVWSINRLNLSVTQSKLLPVK